MGMEKTQMKSLIAAFAIAVLATPALAVSSVPVAGSITGTTVPSGIGTPASSRAFLAQAAVDGANGSITGTTVPSGLCIANTVECEVFLDRAAGRVNQGSITGTLVPSGLCGNGNEQACLDFLAAR